MSIYSLAERKVSFAGTEWYVAETAAVIGSVALGSESSIWFHVVIRGDSENITIGARTNVQDGAVLHADPGSPLILGSNVSVGHGAMLHGCKVGDGSLIGINAVVLNRASIGKGTIIAAGTLIPEGKAIPDGVLVLGSPGKVVRELEQEEKDSLLAVADSYVRRSRHFREHLVRR